MALLQGLPKPQPNITDEQQSQAKAAAKKTKKQRQKTAKQPAQPTQQLNDPSQANSSASYSPPKPFLSPTPPLALTPLVLSETNSSSVIRSSPSAAVGKQPDRPLVPAGPLATEEHEQQGKALSKQTQQPTPDVHPNADANSHSEQPTETTSTNVSAQSLKKTTATGQASKHRPANVHGTAGQESEAEEEEEDDEDDAAGSGAKVGKADACGFGGHTSQCSGVPTAVDTEASFLLQLISCRITKVSLHFMHVCRIDCLCGRVLGPAKPAAVNCVVW